MPTAFSSAVGDMRFSNNDRATIDKHMQRINDDINKEVNEKYNGDYALAKSAIAKKLMSSKNIFNIAQQNYELEAKARDQVNNLIAMGKGPTEFVDDGKGNMVRRNITADELFAGKSVFDSQGNIKGLPNYEIYSAGEHDKWVEDAYSKALNAATSPETISKDPKAVGYLRVAKARGMSDEDVQNYMFGKDGNLNPTGQSIVDTFLKDSPQAAREFAKIKDHNLIGRYVANIIKGQTSKVSDSQFLTDNDWVADEKARIDALKNKPDPALDTFGAKFTGIPETNAFATRQTPMAAEFDKKSGKSGSFWQGMPIVETLFTGDYNNISEIDSEIKRLSGKKLNYVDSRTLEQLKNEKKRFEPIKEILIDYRKKKTPLLKRAGLAEPRTDREWAAMYDADKEYTYMTSDEEYTLQPMAQKGIRNVFKNNAGMALKSAYRLSDDNGLGIVPLAEIADEIGGDENAVLYELQNNDLNYNVNTGEFSTYITNGKIKDGKYTKGDKRRKVNYTLDDVTAEYSKMLKRMKQIKSDNIKSGETMIDNNLMKIVYNGNGTYSGGAMNPYDGTVKTFEKASVEAVRPLIQAFVGSHVKRTYTIPSLTYSQQQNQQD